MTERLNFMEHGREPLRLMFGIENYLGESSIERNLLHLVKFRVSQINGCAYCLDMHSKDLRAEGEDEQRLYLLSAWRESPFYSDRERAALEWAEALTLVAQGNHLDAVLQRVREHFDDRETVDLTIAVNAINNWNRLNIAFSTIPGSYQPGQFAAFA